MVAYNHVVMKIKKVVVFLLPKLYVTVFNSLNLRTHNMVANVHKTMNSKTMVKDSVVNNQDKIRHIITITHQNLIKTIIHLPMLMDRLILVMMTYHSKKMNA